MTVFTIEPLTAEHRDAFDAFAADVAPHISHIFDDSLEFAEGEMSLCLAAIAPDRTMAGFLRVGSYELSEFVDRTCGIVDVLLDDDDDAYDALLAALPAAAKAKGFKHVLTTTAEDDAAALGDAGWGVHDDGIGIAWTGASDGGAIRVLEIPAGSGYVTSSTIVDYTDHFMWLYEAAADRADQQARIDAVVAGLDVMQEAIDGFAEGIDEFHIAY